MADKIRRVTRKQIENSPDVDKENVLYVKHGKKWVNEPAVIVSNQYLEQKQGMDEAYNMKQFFAHSLIESDFPMLTPQQRQVMQATCKGFTQTEIATKLNISQQRVSQLIKQAVKKLIKSIPDFREGK